MLRFLVDTQLPPSLAVYLSIKEYNSIHTTHFQDGHLLADHEISMIAKTENRIIITKDSDFFERYVISGSPPNVLLLQLGNIRNVDLLAFFDRELEKVVTLFQEGSSLVILNRQKIISY